MKRNAIIQVAVLLIFSSLAISAKEPQGITLSELPPRAQQTIKAELKGAQVGEIEKEAVDGKTFYDVVLARGEASRHLTVDAQGNLIRAQVALTETPAPVQKVIQNQLGKNKLGDIDRTSEEGETIFSVDLIAPNGEAHSLSVAEDGKWFSLELQLSEAPGPVQKTIRTHLGKGKLEEISKVNDDGDVYFEADINVDGKTRTLTIGPRGRVLSEEEEVSLKELPEVAQRVVRANLGGGQLTSITKVTEGREITYEVEAMKAGKELSFAVAGDGKFLGFDE